MAIDPKHRFDNALRQSLSDMDVTLSASQSAALWHFHQRVVEANRQFNLTRITDPADAAVKLYTDSLAVVAWARGNNIAAKRVLDVGTGAGFPAVPLAVAQPNWQVTALDGTGKKIVFLDKVCQNMALTNLRAVHGRAETWRDTLPFDVVLFKAVGPIRRCLELAGPHLAVGGYAVVFKTTRITATESAEGLDAAKRLRFTEPKIFDYLLRLADEALSRRLWIMRRKAREPSGRTRRRR